MVCVDSPEQLCPLGKLVLRTSPPWLAATSTPRVSELFCGTRPHTPTAPPPPRRGPPPGRHRPPASTLPVLAGRFGLVANNGLGRTGERPAPQHPLRNYRPPERRQGGSQKNPKTTHQVGVGTYGEPKKLEIPTSRAPRKIRAGVGPRTRRPGCPTDAARGDSQLPNPRRVGAAVPVGDQVPLADHGKHLSRRAQAVPSFPDQRRRRSVRRDSRGAARRYPRALLQLIT